MFINKMRNKINVHVFTREKELYEIDITICKYLRVPLSMSLIHSPAPIFLKTLIYTNVKIHTTNENTRDIVHLQKMANLL